MEILEDEGSEKKTILDLLGRETTVVVRKPKTLYTPSGFLFGFPDRDQAMGVHDFMLDLGYEVWRSACNLWYVNAQKDIPSQRIVKENRTLVGASSASCFLEEGEVPVVALGNYMRGLEEETSIEVDALLDEAQNEGTEFVYDPTGVYPVSDRDFFLEEMDDRLMLTTSSEPNLGRGLYRALVDLYRQGRSYMEMDPGEVIQLTIERTREIDHRQGKGFKSPHPSDVEYPDGTVRDILNIITTYLPDFHAWAFQLEMKAYVAQQVVRMQK